MRMEKLLRSNVTVMKRMYATGTLPDGRFCASPVWVDGEMLAALSAMRVINPTAIDYFR